MVSMARTAGTARPKLSQAKSPALLQWVRSQPCAAAVGPAEQGWGRCGSRPGRGPIEPQHFPSRGSLGGRFDPLTIPLCPAHHDMAQVYKIPRDAQYVMLINNDAYHRVADFLKVNHFSSLCTAPYLR
jgi:hypothetical protein